MTPHLLPDDMAPRRPFAHHDAVDCRPAAVAWRTAMRRAMAGAVAIVVLFIAVVGWLAS